MSNHRYHVHVACVANDPLLVKVQDDVAIFFENRAFLTKDLVIIRPESASYSWRCVNVADVVLLLVGNHYGDTNASGVSQLHVSYTNAKAKNKPMLIFVHADVLSKPANQKLTDFVGVLTLRSGQTVHYFDDTTNISSLLETAFNALDLDKSQGWQMVNVGIKHALLFPPKRQTNATTTQKQASTLDNPQYTKIAPTWSHLTESVSSSYTKTDDNLHALKPALMLDSEFLVSCTAHAFQGGTLIDVSFVIPLRWRNIIIMLASAVMPFSEQGLGRALNEHIDKNLASQIVAKEHPNVHAVSRVQVVKADVLWILDELELAGWIESVGQGAMWQTTDKISNIK
ncbi:hypothetical protein [Moraxella nonliquefaciens]|uniref:hypothetical protein n=1 Tax=Moraxella nonliquefaciens TaxID=478 RepID=UPI00081E32C9|nr:hypothetical protein [Moraxella nonliquefaciens]OBX49543.1 hypothetical protein A9Z65_09480 [Moraxella nonliquefaciens]